MTRHAHTPGPAPRRPAPRPRRPIRRWPRRILILANLGVAACIVAALGGFGYLRYRIDAIHTVAAPDLSRQGKNTADGLAPENILLIGNETRAGLTNPTQIAQFGSPTEYSGSLSDVTMVLHLNPVTKQASILSIPRDLFVPMPAGSPVGAYEKVDAALNDGKAGPDNLIKAITEDFGIPINHYVELNFDGFEQTVDALGGIKMDFPQRLFDQYSLLNISHTGCQLIGGAQALALVRSRHLQYDPPGVSPDDMSNWPFDPESDLARIVRDHTFIRVVLATAESEGLSDPIKANSFLGAITNQITVDPGLRSQLIKLAVHYRGINPNSIPETTLPVTTVLNYSYAGNDEGDVDFPVQPADNRVIANWDSGVLPTDQAPENVALYNTAETADLAQTTGAALTAGGLHVATETDGNSPGSPSETLIQYHSGQVAMGLDVLRRFSGATMLQSDASVPAGTVDVQLGTTEAVLAVHRSSSASGPTTTAGATSSTTAGPSTATTVPTPGGETASSSIDQLTPYDPRPC